MPWRVGDGKTELQVLQATYREESEGTSYLIVMAGTKSDRDLFLLVQRVLVESGANVGAR